MLSPHSLRKARNLAEKELELCHLQVPAGSQAALVGEHREDAAANAAKTKVARDINPAVALALLIADLAARLFCLSIFWMLLVIAVLVSNAALCVALIKR